MNQMIRSEEYSFCEETATKGKCRGLLKIDLFFNMLQYIPFQEVSFLFVFVFRIAFYC